jgi:hypothetical protein
VKGLLHRLAARAVGTAVGVRSDARLPFVGSALIRDAADRAEAIRKERARTDSGAELGGDVSQPHQPERQGLLKASTAAWDIGVVEGLGALGEVRGTLPADASGPLDDADPSVPAQLLPGTPQNDIPSSGARTTSFPRAEAAAPRDGRAIDSRARVLPLDESPPGAGEPVLLMPSAPRNRLATSTTVHSAPHFSAVPEASPIAPTETAAEVHIHIGRIEVTAVHEASRPRRERAPSAPSMSLDAYLAKRGR